MWGARTGIAPGLPGVGRVTPYPPTETAIGAAGGSALGRTGTAVARGLAPWLFSAGAQRELLLVFHGRTNSISSFCQAKKLHKIKY